MHHTLAHPHTETYTHTYRCVHTCTSAHRPAHPHTDMCTHVPYILAPHTLAHPHTDVHTQRLHVHLQIRTHSDAHLHISRHTETCTHFKGKDDVGKLSMPAVIWGGQKQNPRWARLPHTPRKAGGWCWTLGSALATSTPVPSRISKLVQTALSHWIGFSLPSLLGLLPARHSWGSFPTLFERNVGWHSGGQPFISNEIMITFNGQTAYTEFDTFSFFRFDRSKSYVYMHIYLCLSAL